MTPNDSELTTVRRVQLALQLYDTYIKQLTPLGSAYNQHIAEQAAAENGLCGRENSQVSLLILQLYESREITGMEPTIGDWPHNLISAVLYESQVAQLQHAK
jgi:hypothetical protein